MHKSYIMVFSGRIFGSLTILLVLGLILNSCIKYSPYQVTVRNEEEDQTLKNLEKLKNLDQSGDTVTFAFIGDTQRFYEEAYDFVFTVNQIPEVEFVVISGDLTDFGLIEEFSGMLKILKNLEMPFLTVVGNHDLIYNGQEIYEEMFGELDYSFYFKNFKFIMLNTNGREFGFNGEVPNIDWLDRELSDTGNYVNSVVVSHIPPGNDDFDNTLEYAYANTLSKWEKTTLSMNGHNHDFAVGQPYNDGVIYLNSFSVGKGSFLIVKMWKNGFEYIIEDIK